jgi:carbon storage regulator
MVWPGSDERRKASLLILSRRIGETLRLGPDITVTVVGMKGSQVRIGIEAPRSVIVHREELYQRLQREAAVARWKLPA